MNDFERTLDKIQNAIDQRCKDDYPADFRIPELFDVTLGDLNTLVNETQKLLRLTNQDREKT